MEQTFYIYKSSKGKIIVSYTKLGSSYKLLTTAPSLNKANEIRKEYESGRKNEI